MENIINIDRRQFIGGAFATVAVGAMPNVVEATNQKPNVVDGYLTDALENTVVGLALLDNMLSEALNQGLIPRKSYDKLTYYTDPYSGKLRKLLESQIAFARRNSNTMPEEDLFRIICQQDPFKATYNFYRLFRHEIMTNTSAAQRRKRIVYQTDIDAYGNIIRIRKASLNDFLKAFKTQESYDLRSSKDTCE